MFRPPPEKRVVVTRQKRRYDDDGLALLAVLTCQPSSRVPLRWCSLATESAMLSTITFRAAFPLIITRPGRWMRLLALRWRARLAEAIVSWRVHYRGSGSAARLWRLLCSFDW